MTVLERIRMKQKQRERDNQLRISKEVLRERALISRLPSFVDLLDSNFASSQKSSLYLNDITKKIMSTSHTPMTDFETSKLLNKIVEIVPVWCSLMKSEFGTLVKLNRNLSRKEVLEAINNRLEKMHTLKRPEDEKSS